MKTGILSAEQGNALIEKVEELLDPTDDASESLIDLLALSLLQED
jgi:hypothetical protein